MLLIAASLPAFLALPSYAELRTSESYIIETDVLPSGSTSESSTNRKNYDTLGQTSIGSGTSESYKNYSGFGETNGTSPETPTDLAQYKLTGATVEVGAWANSSKMVFKFKMYDQDASDVFTPQIELRPTSEAFDGTVTKSGGNVAFSGTSVEGVVTSETLTLAETYHWRARVMDSANLTSPWVSYGGNAEDEMDFGVDITAPAVSILTPQNSEIIYWAGTYEITWVVTEEGGSGLIAGPVTLYRSTNGGVSWTTIASGQDNDGSYVWHLPKVTASNCRISVEAADNAGNIGKAAKAFEIFSAAWIKGTITLSGETDHSGAIVEAYDESQAVGSTETAADGSYTMRVVCGTLSVEAAKSGFEIKVYDGAVSVLVNTTVEGIDISGINKAWPMFKQDKWHTSGSPDQAINAPLCLKWTYMGIARPPIVTGTTIYGTSGARLFALNLDGTFKWSLDKGTGTPAFYNGTVYVGAADSKVYALNEDGTVKWTYLTGGAISTSPCVAYGTVYIGSGDGKLYALSEGGEPKWSYNASGSSTPAVYNGSIYYNVSGKLYSIGSNGSVNWTYTFPAGGGTEPPAAANGIIYVGSSNNKLYAIKQDGTFYWSFNVNNDALSPSVSDGTVYFGIGSPAEIYALEENGTFKWSYRVGSTGSGRSVVTVANGKVYFMADSRVFAATDSGALLWSYSLNPGSGNANEPAILNGMAYFAFQDLGSAHKLFAFENNLSPEAPTVLMQYLYDGVTTVATGEWMGSRAVMKMLMSDPNVNDTLYAQVETQPTGDAFSDSAIATGPAFSFEGSAVNGIVTAEGLSNLTGYHWQARVKDLWGKYGPWASFGGNGEDQMDFLVDAASPEIPTSPEVVALPSASPTYVLLSWSPCTDEAPGMGFAGYNFYRSQNPDDGMTKRNSAILTSTSTTDSGMFYGGYYYFRVTAVDNGGNESAFSNYVSPPNVYVTKLLSVEAPKSGGYSGGNNDAVPGSTLTYTIMQKNNGYGYVKDMVTKEKIPSYTAYKIGSATGTGATTMEFSDDNGAKFTYTPTGEVVDAAVTNIRWIYDYVYVDQTKTVTFKVIIK
jgi:outer membrane protein assembly factor BamB